MPAVEPILQLRDALKTRLDTELTAAIGSAVTVEKRYSPYLDPGDLESPKWLLLLNAETIDAQLRGLAPGELVVEVALQAALPPTTDRDADYFATDTIDAWVELVGVLKSFYRPGGVMRDVRLADCEFRRYTNAPLYRPDLLVAHGIFTSAVLLTYYLEHNDD